MPSTQSRGRSAGSASTAAVPLRGTALRCSRFEGGCGTRPQSGLRRPSVLKQSSPSLAARGQPSKRCAPRRAQRRPDSLPPPPRRAAPSCSSRSTAFAKAWPGGGRSASAAPRSAAAGGLPRRSRGRRGLSELRCGAAAKGRVPQPPSRREHRRAVGLQGRPPQSKRSPPPGHAFARACFSRRRMRRRGTYGGSP